MDRIISLQTGEDFFAGCRRFVLEQIEAPGIFRLRRIDTDQLIQIGEREMVEVAPEIRCQAVPRSNPKAAGIRIVAPDHIPLARGENFRTRLARELGIGQVPMPDFDVTPKAEEQGERLGLTCDTEIVLRHMARHGARVTHPRGNYRYVDFVMQIADKREIRSVDYLDPLPSRDRKEVRKRQ